MLESITTANYKDFAYRYQDTYGFITTDSGKKIVVYIKEVGPAYTLVVDREGNSFQLVSDRNNVLEFTQVISGWLSPEPGNIVYVSRVPERQWKRGINSNNTSIKLPGGFGEGATLFGICVSSDVLSQLYHPNPDIVLFDSKLKCGLWSKYFAWAGKYVWAKDICIGMVDHLNKTITLEQDLLKQELSDTIRRSNNPEYVVC